MISRGRSRRILQRSMLINYIGKTAGRKQAVMKQAKSSRKEWYNKVREANKVRDNNDENGQLGFNLKKILDKKSVFFGLPSLNAIESYVSLVIHNWGLVPNSKDGKWEFRFKIAALSWILMRRVISNKAEILNRKDLLPMDFGESTEIISTLLDEILEPDEIFRPKHNSAFIPGGFQLYRYPVRNGYMYWVMNVEVVAKVLVTKDVKKEDIIELIWNKLGRVIQLEVDGGSLNYVKTELNQKKIFGSTNDLIKKLHEDYNYFRENKLSRGYLLIGNPGTGKTGIVNSLVDKTDGRVFVINGMETSSVVDEMTSLFVEMQPDFIIFDDCDRSQSSPAFIKYVLKMLETVKDKNPHTNFLFTANTFSGILFDEAVTRKGRIDQIYEVPEPNDSDRKEIFQKYFYEMNINFSDEELDKCVTSSDGMTGADIKELCIQLQRATIDEVFERANEVELLKSKYSGEHSPLGFDGGERPFSKRRFDNNLEMIERALDGRKIIRKL